QETDNGPFPANLGFPSGSSAMSGTYDAASGQISATDQQSSGDCTTVLSGPMGGHQAPLLDFRGNPWDLVAFVGYNLSCQGGYTITVNISVPGGNQPPANP